MEKQIKISASMCDNTAKLSIPDIFTLFMDIASEHGSDMGFGSDKLAKKGLLWLTVKTKIRIFNRPNMMETVTAATWPEKPGRVRCNRYYKLSDNSSLLAVGKTEWTVADLKTGRPIKLAEVFSDDIDFCPDVSCAKPYFRIDEDFSECEEISSYRIRSTDIDIGQHMNNAAYVRVLFGAFSCAELKNMNISEVEIAFRSPCYENDELSVRCRRNAETIEIGMLRGDGVTAAAARIITT